MGFYTNTQCPGCGFSFSEGFRRTGVKSSLGLPFMKCPRCKTICETGSKVWSMMGQGEKHAYIINRVGQALINSIFFIVVLSMISELVLGIEANPFALNKSESAAAAFIAIVVLSLSISGFTIYINSKTIIKKLEEIYKQKDKDHYADIE